MADGVNTDPSETGIDGITLNPSAVAAANGIIGGTVVVVSKILVERVTRAEGYMI